MEATAFAEACQAQGLSAPPSKDLDTDDAEACIEAFGQQVEDRMPEQADAWPAAADLLRAMTALLSRSAPARAAARSNQELVAALERMLGLADPGCAAFVRQLLQVLDEEELVVLHPELGRGYRVRNSGVADNFQLDVLLAAALIGDPGAGLVARHAPGPQGHRGRQGWPRQRFAADRVRQLQAGEPARSAPGRHPGGGYRRP